MKLWLILLFIMDLVYISWQNHNSEPFNPRVEGIPDCAKQNGFCESVPDYPSEMIEEALKNLSPELKNLFGTDKLNPKRNLSQNDMRVPRSTPNLNISDPSGQYPKELENTGAYIETNELCKTIQMIGYPKMAKTYQGDWMYIPNTHSYIQGVLVQKCKHEGETPCDETVQYNKMEITATCRTEYIFRKLLAINNNGTFVRDLFKMPSCCKCFISSNKHK